MAKARSRRKPARRPSTKATGRRGKKAPARGSKRKPAKPAAAARRPASRAAVRTASPARTEKPRVRKVDDVGSQLPEIPPPLPAPIASFTF